MTSPRTIFIGDIHGCITEFKELYAKLQVREEDTVICLGDFMDKGPLPVACVEFAREQGMLSIMGNHEERHLKWRRHWERAKVNPAYVNPMTRPLTPEDAESNLALDQRNLDWLRHLPTTMRPLPNWVAVHGGLFPIIPLEEQAEDKIMRLRWLNAENKHIPLDYSDLTRPPGSNHWADVYDGPYNVVYGHEAHSLSTPRIDVRPQGVACYGIDTGVVHGGRLTALVVQASHVDFVQVQAKQVYMKPPNGPIPD